MNRRQWLHLTSISGFAALFPGCAFPANYPKIDFAAAERLGGEGYGIWKGGHLLESRNPDKRLPSLSITKALAALLAVRAVGEGWLELDNPLDDIVPEWRADERKRQISLRMLVNQTAGFSPGASDLYRRRVSNK